MSWLNCKHFPNSGFCNNQLQVDLDPRYLPRWSFPARFVCSVGPHVWNQHDMGRHGQRSWVLGFLHRNAESPEEIPSSAWSPPSSALWAWLFSLKVALSHQTGRLRISLRFYPCLQSRSATCYYPLFLTRLWWHFRGNLFWPEGYVYDVEAAWMEHIKLGVICPRFNRDE